MSQINIKSISGITSITTPAGVDNQLTLHTNNTTQAFKLDHAGNLHFNNHVNASGIVTAATFKGDGDFVELDVDGHTNLDNVSIAGVTTVTNNYFDFKPNGGGNAHFRILSTGSGDAGIFFDAANGDIAGSDYVFIGQKNNLDFVIDANANAGNIDFQRAGTSQVRITSGGQVNIGSSSGVLSQTTFKSQIETATNKLISFGAAEGSTYSDQGAALIFSRPQDGATKICGIYQHSNQSLGIGARDDFTISTGGDAFYYSATERLRITSTGLVGIATNSPSAALLDIATDQGSNDHLRLRRLSSDSNVATNWSLKPYAGNLYFRTGGSTDKIYFDDSGDINVMDGNLVIATAGHGIDFSATPNGYAGSINETLDDYEEGYFTPTVGGWSASGSGVYGSGGQRGRYTKVGNLVTVFFHVYWTALNNASGVFAIENLPFAHSSSTYNLSTAVQMRYVDYSGDTVFAVGGNGYSSSLLFYAQNDNGNHNYVPIDSNGGRIEGTVTYLTDS